MLEGDAIQSALYTSDWLSNKLYISSWLSNKLYTGEWFSSKFYISDWLSNISYISDWLLSNKLWIYNKIIHIVENHKTSKGRVEKMYFPWIIISVLARPKLFISWSWRQNPLYSPKFLKLWICARSKILPRYDQNKKKVCFQKKFESVPTLQQNVSGGVGGCK